MRGYFYKTLDANGTFTVAAGPGLLVRTVTGLGGSPDARATIYDSLTGSGTKIAVLDFSLGGILNNFELRFVNGITIVLSGTTPGNLTVIWDNTHP